MRNPKQAFIAGPFPSPFMGSLRPAVLALLASLLVFWSLFTPALGQNPAGHMVVATDYELFGTSELSGGGHVTWTLTGAKAADLRGKILHMFDEYPSIPRGFPFEGELTAANMDGILEPAEGVRYTDLLENVLERPGGAVGTLAQYMELYPFDLREKNSADPGLGFERSTSGLANTNLSTSADAEIRFLFEANTTTRNARVSLSTLALAESLYKVFSYQAIQSPTLTPSGPYPGSWPFLLEGGWHVVNVSGRRALWAGNDSTGMYDNNVAAVTRTTVNPALAVSLPIYIPFDLRFASRAWATFNYTGRLADAGDHLRLQIAHAPAFTDWTNLAFDSRPDLLPTAVGIWSNATVNLSSYLGGRVRLRWNFTSDGAGTATGFFLRDFALHAPSFYEGEVVQGDTHYLIGTLSFSDPAFASGGIQLIRTPGGEILQYRSTWDGTSLPADTIQFRTFDVTENPQILFVVMIAASYAISRLQESAYDGYREAHPAAYRPAVHRAKWLHRLGLLGIAVLILFYFVPTVTWFIGVRIFVSGPAYWFLALTLALLLGLGTRAYYRQQLEEVPPPVAGEERVVVKKVAIPTGPPEETADVATRKPVAVEPVRNAKPVSLRCESCGELQTVPEGADPRAATCANCGGRLRHIDEGKRYLIVASNPSIAFGWLRDLTKGGKPALCVTPAAPERLRLEFGVQGVSIVQVSAHAAGGVDPKKLDPAGLKVILPLVRQRKGGVILYDGLDQIVSQASMDDVIRFLRKANDMAFVHGVTVIARVAPGVLADPELRRLNAEFDEFLDLSAQL